MGTHSGIKKALRKVFTREGWLAGKTPLTCRNYP